MASISSLGVGSGLDLSSILDSLTAAQKATLTPISNQQSSFTAKLSAYGTLKSALTNFQTANTALSKADLFSATSTTSSTTAFSATTAGNEMIQKRRSPPATANSPFNKAATKIRFPLISARLTRL